MKTIVKATLIKCTQTIVYTAWEEYNGHSDFGHIDGILMGRIGTSKLPDSIDKLKAYSEERSRAVREWQKNEYERAYNAILAEHPHAARGKKDMGDIEI